MTLNLDPKQIAENVDAKSDDLIAEFEKHYAELVEANPEHKGQRELAFQSWIIQKVAGLQLCITELESRLAEGGYRLISCIGADGDALAISYGGTGAITSIVTAAGETFLFNDSPSGYLTNVHDVVGSRDVTMVYSNDLLIEITDMGGQTFKYGYDANGFLTSLKCYRPN